MEHPISLLIDQYKRLWAEAKKAEFDASQNTRTKLNRERLLIARTKKECFADFLNELSTLSTAVENNTK